MEQLNPKLDAPQLATAVPTQAFGLGEALPWPSLHAESFCTSKRSAISAALILTFHSYTTIITSEIHLHSPTLGALSCDFK